MKNIFTLLALLPAACTAYGQAITITASDMPMPAAAYHCEDISGVGALNPTISTGAAWNYSLFSGPTFTNTFSAETDTFFTNHGVNFFQPGFKTLNSTASVGYNMVSEIDFNSSNVQESGMAIPAQAYDLSAYTGGTNDSLVIPAQKYNLATPKVLVSFPFTAGSAWNSVSRRSVDMTITVDPLLDHVPSQHVYYQHRRDTIAGWGTMRVHTISGPSIAYDVLVDKIAQYAVDSFYISGSPASSTLLSMFDVTQGQKTDSAYRYNFYRKGSFNYLFSTFYGSDASYTTPEGIYYNTDNLTTEVAVHDISGPAFTTVVFPNPANGNEINVLCLGREINGGSYIITDAAGRTIQSGTVVAAKGQVSISLSALVTTGSYFLTVIDQAGNKLTTEQFSAAK